MNQKLTKKEEELMKILWNLKKAFVKEMVEQYPDPKPERNQSSRIAQSIHRICFSILQPDFI